MAVDPNLLIIGIDAEWVHIPDTDDNQILSYQYYGMSSAGNWSEVIYPTGPYKKDRMKLVALIGKAIEKGREQKLLPHKWPLKVYIAAHFARADLSAFADFNKLKSQFDSVRKTYSSITDTLKKTYIDKSNNSHPLEFTLIDTMLISPNGASLASLGELHKVQKVILPIGVIERMDLLLQENPELFESYGIRDAEISAKHAWYMAEFVSEHLNQDNPPTTLGTLAINHFLSLLMETETGLNLLLGKELITETKWNSRLGHNVTNKRKSVPTDLVHLHENIAKESFHGGRNEAFVFGYTEEGYWVDVDLSGAYTTAMAAIKVPDWSAIRAVSEVDSFKVDELGIALIDFKFPKGTQYPCLPVRSDNGLIYPLEGRTHVGSPEIVLAEEMGADIVVYHGVIVPWLNEDRPFESFSIDILRRRSENVKGSPTEKTWKEIGNSLYGKLAQGIKEKRAFDSREGSSSILPPSKVTQPYLAAYLTSIVRAVLGELLSKLPADKKLISATTDGFISNLPLKEIDTSGPLCRFFSSLRKRISGDETILETKHVANSYLCWKTRGQVDASPDVDEDSFEAKAGIKLPDGLKAEALENFDPSTRFDDHSVWFEGEIVSEMGLSFWEPDGIESYARCKYMADLFLNRASGQTHNNSYLISMRDMFDSETDMIMEDHEHLLNMDYDWKRELITPLVREHVAEDDGNVSTHIYAETRPWKSVDEFNRVRGLFDVWRLKNNGVLKTMVDWERWQEYLRTDAVSKKGIRRSKSGEIEQVKSNFLRAYVKAEWGLPGDGKLKLAKFLTDNGYPTTKDKITYEGRSKREPLEHAFERTDKIMKFVDLMLERYPSFDWEKMFVDDRDY